jgi:hypothetical protein
MMSTTLTLSERLREAAVVRGEQLLAELPATLRRVRLSISVPVFLAAVVALLVWRLLG